jgi:hypothetical protein
MHRPTLRLSRRLHPLAGLFIALAVADVIWYVLNASFGPTSGPADVLAYAVQIVPSVAVFLMPAVFLTRHPDATWRARTLLLGLFLVAISQTLLIVSTPLQSVFAALTPATAELPIIWSSALFDDVTSLIFAVGLAYMAFGLTQVRRYEGHARSLTLLFVTVMAIFGTVVGIVSVARIDLSSLTMSAGLAFYLGSIVIFGVVRIVAWAYLTAAAAGGAAAGEDPPAGWRLATLGGAAVLLALTLVNIGGLFEIADQTLDTLYGYVTIGLYALGLVFLLAAFVVRLPALGEDEDEDEEGDEDTDDEDADDADDEEDGDDEDDDR